MQLISFVRIYTLVIKSDLTGCYKNLKAADQIMRTLHFHRSRKNVSKRYLLMRLALNSIFYS